jgi:hypothetical protein
MKAKTSKEQMSSLLRKAQQLQAMSMGYPISVEVSTRGLDMDGDTWFVLRIVEEPSYDCISYKTIYPFHEYAYNCEQLAQFEKVIMSRIEL